MYGKWDMGDEVSSRGSDFEILLERGMLLKKIYEKILKHGENDYYQPLSNGHKLFSQDIRWVVVCAAVAMDEEGDMVVSLRDPILLFLPVNLSIHI